MNWLNVMTFTLVSTFSAAAFSKECWVFRDASDPETELKSLTVEVEPATSKDSEVHVGKIRAVRRTGAPIVGQSSCRKQTPTEWRCQIMDDRGSFLISINGASAEFTASHLLLGDGGDTLDFVGDEIDPLRLKGQACAGAKSSTKRQ